VKRTQDSPLLDAAATTRHFLKGGVAGERVVRRLIEVTKGAAPDVAIHGGNGTVNICALTRRGLGIEQTLSEAEEWRRMLDGLNGLD
jgi:hypothetical protein